MSEGAYFSVEGTAVPELTFYIYKGTKHKRIPINTIHDWPTDWLHLKSLANECALSMWQEHSLASALMTLELHLPGHFITKTKPGTYSPVRVRNRREVQWMGRVTFNPKTFESTVEQCVFGPHLMLMSGDYYAIERSIKYRAPSLIPKMHQAIAGDLKSLLMDPSGVRYADYSRKPKDLYGSQDEEAQRRALYDPPCVDVREYLPPGLHMREMDLATRKSAPTIR